MLATEPSLQPWIILYCVNVTHLSIHLLMGHLNSSHLLTIVNNTTVITKYTPISSKCCFPFIHLPRSRGTGSHSNTYLAFFLNKHFTFFLAVTEFFCTYHTLSLTIQTFWPINLNSLFYGWVVVLDFMYTFYQFFISWAFKWCVLVILIPTVPICISFFPTVLKHHDHNTLEKKEFVWAYASTGLDSVMAKRMTEHDGGRNNWEFTPWISMRKQSGQGNGKR